MKIKLKKLTAIVAAFAVVLTMVFFNPNHTKAASTDVTVDLSGTQQIIRGFGTCTAWNGALSDTDMNYLFTDMGLSILRVRIDPNGSSYWGDELSNAKKAQARGAIVFATPWTPPAYMKTNNSLINGGELLTSQYANYAAYLKSYVDYMSSNGAPLYAISLQNEPDWAPDYESCTWSSSQFLNFIKNYGSTLGNTKIIMPESLNFSTSLSDATLNDATASSYVSIVGGHLYGATISKYDLALNKGKEVWMTEHYTDGQSLSNALDTAKEIHDCLTVANMSAYTWWWNLDNNMGFLNASHVPQKRGYVVGQFAKFVRNGYYRVNATYNPQSNVYVSAFKGDNKAVFVAINQGTSAVSQTFNIQNGTLSSVSSYITDSTRNIASASSFNVSNGSFTATLPAQSVTTFVGSLSSSTTLNPYSTLEAESFSGQSGIQSETCSEGGSDIGFIENGDYIVYNNVDFGTSGASSFQARVASNTSGGNIEIRLDSSTGTLVGTCPVAGTGGWQTWATKTCTVSGATGVHNLYLKLTGGSGYLFNVNWSKFTQNTGGTTVTVECENMTKGGPYVGTITSPFSGVALYANGDYCSTSVNFTSSTNTISVRGASNNSSTAKASVYVGGTKVGEVSFTGTTASVQSLTNVSTGTGSKEVKILMEADTGVYDAYVDYVKIN